MILTDADELRAALRVALQERDEARAERDHFRAEMYRLEVDVQFLRASGRIYAEHQREACAQYLIAEELDDAEVYAGHVRTTPLVTEKQP